MPASGRVRIAVGIVELRAQTLAFALRGKLWRRGPAAGPLPLCGHGRGRLAVDT